ncbi:MAG: hypothetical protein IRY91_00440 [Gemmatimonadaceae bacterium]|nr:hypothetical protein [Gemmatimonadaceae bacterium]
MNRTTHLLALTGIMLVAACDPAPTAAGGAIDRDAVKVETRRIGDRDTDVRKDLATLRRVTAKLHRFSAAKVAGWDTKITPCMFSAQGGMGYHYGRPQYINDGKVQVDEPELLLFEPEKNGRFRLVAVEYILPGSPTDPAPSLFGRSFTYNTTFGVWALHAWVWRNNPSGIFADWNPRVSCAYATDVLAM